MRLSKLIKRDSKLLLTNNYGKGVLIILIISIINFIINFVDGLAFNLCGYDLIRLSEDIYNYSQELFTSPIPFIISFVGFIIKMLLIVPIMIGTLNFYLNITDKENVSVSDIFNPYESKLFGKSILMWLNLGIKRLFISLLFVAIPIAVISVGVFISLQADMHPLFAPMLIIVGSLVLLVALFLIELFMQRYALAPILICNKYSYGVHKAVKTSTNYMKHHKGELIGFKLSYIGYLIPFILVNIMYFFTEETDFALVMPMKLLVFVVTTLTALFFVPYYLMGTTMYKRYLFELGEHISNANGQAVQGTIVNDINQQDSSVNVGNLNIQEKNTNNEYSNSQINNNNVENISSVNAEDTVITEEMNNTNQQEVSTQPTSTVIEALQVESEPTEQEQKPIENTIDTEESNTEI